MMTSDQVLRTGVLFKKGSGTGPFGRKNWKPRYFVLTPTKLTYYTYEDGDLKGVVDLKGCTDQSIEVMPADAMKTGSSASTIWRVAVNGADRRLLVAAGTEMEMNDWVEQLLMAFRINSGQPIPPTRQSLDQVAAHMPAAGAIMNASMGNDLSRHSITDFQNFASARRSVGSAVRASLGAMPSHEFRLSDELERTKAMDQDRVTVELEMERKDQEELLLAQQRSQAEERRTSTQQEQALLSDEQQDEQQRLLQQHEESQRLLAQQQQQQFQEEEEAQRVVDEQARMEALLEEQRRLKREKHEREREEAEKKLLELELEEQEKRHEVEVRRHFDEDVVEVEIRRRPMPQPQPQPQPVASTSVHEEAAPRSSLIGDAKKEAMARQTAEHTKRREAAMKEQQEQLRLDFLAQQQQQEDALRASHGQHMTVSPPHSPPQNELLCEPVMSPAKRLSVAKLDPASSVEF